MKVYATSEPSNKQELDVAVRREILRAYVQGRLGGWIEFACTIADQVIAGTSIDQKPKILDRSGQVCARLEHVTYTAFLYHRVVGLRPARNLVQLLKKFICHAILATIS